MATVFLHAPQDFRNICLLARTLEAFGHRECHIFDPHRLIRERYGKSRTRDQRSISAGAFEKMLWIRVESPEEFLANHDGRVVATVANAEATPLGHHQFAPTDLLLFGSESHGLPPKVIAACAATVTIPTRGQTQSLNLVVALGIVLFERQRQLESQNKTRPTDTEPGDDLLFHADIGSTIATTVTS